MFTEISGSQMLMKICQITTLINFLYEVKVYNKSASLQQLVSNIACFIFNASETW